VRSGQQREASPTCFAPASPQDTIKRVASKLILEIKQLTSDHPPSSHPSNMSSSFINNQNKSSSTLYRSPAPPASTQDREARLKRIRSMFKPKAGAQVRTTPEYFKNRMKENQVKEMQRTQEVKTLNSGFRMSFRSLAFSPARRVRETNEWERRKVAESKTLQSTVRLSMGSIMSTKPRNERESVLNRVGSSGLGSAFRAKRRSLMRRSSNR
jgi:hypothetical protein